MKECHQKLWREMLNSEMNSEYFGALASRFSRWDKWSKIFLAITSSGVVAGWTIFNDPAKYPYGETAWHIASGLATITAIALPIFNPSKKAEWATALKVAYQSVANDYEFIWLRRESQTDDKLLDETRKGTMKEKALSNMEIHFPERNEKLLKKCQKAIIKRRNLSS